jgi:uncharacterized protein
VAIYSRRPEYHAAAQQDWQPIATYTLLGIIGAVYVAQWATLAVLGLDWHRYLFVVDLHWYEKPWTLITATLAHSPALLFHIIFNGIVLFFFGPILERLIGRQRFVILFFLAGAVASLAQVYFNWLIFQANPGGLGASGALFMILGALVIVMPNEKILIWGIIPVPFWAAAIGFAVIDILGALNPASGVGNVAHLSGMVIGLWVGWQLRQKMKQQGLHLVGG